MCWESMMSTGLVLIGGAVSTPCNGIHCLEKHIWGFPVGREQGTLGTRRLHACIQTRWPAALTRVRSPHQQVAGGPLKRRGAFHTRQISGHMDLIFLL